MAESRCQNVAISGASGKPAPGFGFAARVADGTRTRDHRDHNPGLYQLSYGHLAHVSIPAGGANHYRLSGAITWR